MNKFIVLLLSTLICIMGIQALFGTSEKDIRSWTEELTIATAGGADTTNLHETHRYMMLTMEAGMTECTPDSFAVSRDSTGVDVFVQTLSNRTTGVGGQASANVVSHLQVFNPFKGQLRAVSTNPDSYSVIIDLLEPTATALTAGTGDWDSTLIYQNQLVDYAKPQLMGEWMRVIIDDGTDNTVDWGTDAAGLATNGYIVRVTYHD